MSQLDLDIDNIKPNNIRRCIRCKRKITENNDSGWQGFVSPLATQPYCNLCWEAHCKEPITIIWPDGTTISTRMNDG